MIKTLIKGRIKKEEKALGVSLDYVKHILEISLPAFLKFSKIFSISDYRRKLPLDAYHVARIIAARDEDCGTCVQIELNLALREGVSKAVIEHTLANDPQKLPDNLGLIYNFIVAILLSAPDQDALRDRVREQYGEEGLVELSMAIGASRFLPIVKRTLGYGTACSLVSLDLVGTYSKG